MHARSTPPWKRILRQTFGLRQLRPGQREVIENVLSGRDTLAIMPTGAGKSLCYQLPAMQLPGQTVVVSPLISLMRDQAEKLDQAGVETSQVNSSLAAREEAQALQAVRSETSEVVFTTPERLGQEEFLAALTGHHIDLLVVDEAHCISQWGHDFRPAFLEIRNAAERLRRPPILALTATATPQVVEDIKQQLGAPQMQVINAGIYRENLDYGVIQVTNDAERRSALLDFVTRSGGTGIVYTATVKAAVESHALLREAGIEANLYHGRMRSKDRHRSQDEFMSGSARVMVATNAFGMGIDKADIRWVAHLQLPATLEAYYQESGRAGRDGERACCLLIHDSRDRRLQQFFLARRYPDAQEIGLVCRALEVIAPDAAVRIDDLRAGLKSMPMPAARLQVVMNLLVQHAIVEGSREAGYRLLQPGLSTQRLEKLAQEYAKRGQMDRDKLERMVFYAQTAFCRWAVLLTYFEEDAGWSQCGHCDNCRHPVEARTEPSERSEPLVRRPAFEVGSPVRVPRYGEGRVTQTVGENVTVQFPDGANRRFIQSAVEAADKSDP